MAVAETISAEASLNPGVQALEQFNEGNGLRLMLARYRTHLDCSLEIKAKCIILAACLYQMEQLEDAEMAIRTAVSIEPSKESYLNTYGVILRKNKRIEEAGTMMVIKLKPDLPMFIIIAAML